MIDIMPDDKEISKALNVLNNISDKLRYEKICEISEAQKNTYKKLLEKFKQLHDISPTDNAPKNLHNLKGEALENLVSYLLTISGNIFNVDRNLRTSTNEIDQIVTLTPQGKVLLTYHLIDPKLDTFLGECKNYDKAVSVTYIGKFCSLLLTNNIKIGILFSYYGTSGTGWSNGAGLIKKFYLHKEKLEDKYCIIDFSIKEFEAILNGKNLLQIIDEQLKSLQFDTDYSRYLSKHPAEDYAYLGLPANFLIFDEYVAFMEMLGTKENAAVLNKLKQIVMLGRQAGFSLILACQRPDAKYLGDGIRDQFNFRVALGRMSEMGYGMMFGETTKDFFLKQIKGRGYVDVGTSVISEFYTPLVPKGHDFLKEIKKLTDSRQGVQAACEAKAAEAD